MRYNPTPTGMMSNHAVTDGARRVCLMGVGQFTICASFSTPRSCSFSAESTDFRAIAEPHFENSNCLNALVNREYKYLVNLMAKMLRHEKMAASTGRIAAC
jgi:hypothetical protein